MNITRFANVVSPTGRRVETTFAAWGSELVRWCSGELFCGDQKHPGWSPATFRGDCRALENVESVAALCLDFDGGATVEAVVELFAGRFGVLTSTRRHSASTPRFRLVMPLKREATAREHTVVFRAAAEKLTRAGLAFDAGCRDASRFWFMGGRLDPRAPVVARWIAGLPIDVDALLAWAARRDVKPPNVVHRDPKPDNVAPAARSAGSYARAALEHAVDAVRGAPVGERNSTLVREAFCLGGLPGLDEREVKAELLAAALEAGLPEHEASGAIGRGMRAGAAKPRQGAA